MGLLLALSSLGVAGLGLGRPIATSNVTATIVLGPGGVCGDCDGCTIDNQTGHDFTAATGGDWAGPAHGCVQSPSPFCNSSHIRCGALASADSVAPTPPEVLAQLVYAATMDPTGAKAAELQERFPELAHVVDGGQFLEVRRSCDPRVVEALIPLPAGTAG